MKLMEQMAQKGRMHPVYTSHAEELEKLLLHNAVRLERYRARKETGSAVYRMLFRMHSRCAELYMRMLAEDGEIMLVDDLDYWWIRKFCGIVRDVIDAEGSPQVG